MDVFEYKLPTEKQLEKNFEYRITKDEEYSVIKDYKSVEDAWVNILKSRNHNLEEIIESKIKKIEQGHKEKVDAIFASQLPETVFRQYCQKVIDNQGTPEQTAACLQSILGIGE